MYCFVVGKKLSKIAEIRQLHKSLCKTLKMATETMREVHIIYGDLQHICINRLYVGKIL